uniref:Uncharacterized protein n=1 Tax=Proboscia inermis TaxID=420281 RepID=A0A7S0C7P6_9STRA|mmetsp:Transcript_32283/g.32582  ORF Transcript_32283/g.32582 Transcript_32283/m.32582 type:complete len:356 (+) Transcript_32283:235-1302(+)
MNSDGTSESCITTITNPGMIDRLEQDISEYERFGFAFTRVTGTGTTSQSALFHRTEGIPTPTLATLWLSVSDQSLAASVGPFLRTLVRICDINPRSLRVYVSFDWAIVEATPVDIPRRIGHEIHMMIRNSMASALFLDLHVILPMTLSQRCVVESMTDGADGGCYAYPTVMIHERTDDMDSLLDSQRFVWKQTCNLLPLDCLEGIRLEEEHIYLAITTRMCTVRFTPVLFHLSNLLRTRTRGRLTSKHVEPMPPRVPPSATPTASLMYTPPLSDTWPVLLVCVEKLANLFRVVVLCHDYPGALSNLVLVTHPSLLSRFQKEAHKTMKIFHPMLMFQRVTTVLPAGYQLRGEVTVR